MEKGDILISNLTNPNYNPAFEKINAVVTDEGGILCHSAIMAREFHLPCVVGTKIATKVLKTGDLVEAKLVSKSYNEEKKELVYTVKNENNS